MYLLYNFFGDIMKRNIYFIRHAKAEKLKDKYLSSQESQLQNEKLTLTLEGIKQAEELIKIEELQKITELWSSNYERTMATASYIAKKLGLDIKVDASFGERKLGDLNALENLGKTKKYKYTTEQLLNKDLKNVDGESRKEVEERMYDAIMRILENTVSENIAVISHGAAIKFLLMKWCTLDKYFNIIYNEKVICTEDFANANIIKLIFEEKTLINIENISK